MKKVESSTLTGNALLWAAVKALGFTPEIFADRITYQDDVGNTTFACFLDDEGAGVLMAAEWIGVERPSKGQNPPVWRAITDNKMPPNPRDLSDRVVSTHAESLGVAVCRALVLSRIGSHVKVPAKLTQ